MMAKANVASAIVDRWDDCDLDTEIAPLWRSISDSYNFGSRNSASTQPFGSNPEELDASQAIPRAEFAVGTSDVDEETIGFKAHAVPVEIRVFGADDLTVEDWLDLIDSKFDFGDQAGTNPVAMDSDEATIFQCRSVARSVMPYDKGIWVGELVFEVQWARDISVPA